MDENASASGKPAIITNNKNQTQNTRPIGGFLETSKAKRSVWLMKCPSLVSHSLRSPLSTNYLSSPVAKVIVSVDLPRSSLNKTKKKSSSPSSPSTPMLTIPLPSSPWSWTSRNRGIHRNHTLWQCLRNSFQCLCLPSYLKLFLEGKIPNKFNVKPNSENLEKYGKLCRERTKKYMTKNRQVQVFLSSRTHMRPMPGMMTTSFTVHEKKKPPAKASDTKRTRRDRGEMEDIMFKLFERQPNWSLRQLVQETDQPELFLKDMLKELCVYIRKGKDQFVPAAEVLMT